MGLDHTLAAGIEFDLRHYRRWRARLAELDTLLADVPEGRRDLAAMEEYDAALQRIAAALRGGGDLGPDTCAGGGTPDRT